MRRVGRVEISDEDRLVFSGERLSAMDFNGRRVAQFSAAGCRFEGCRFDNMVIDSGSFGAGRAVSEYLGCTFSGAKMHMGPGGYARFVDCSFDDVRIDNWICYAVELVGCIFSGRIRRAVFNGTVRPEAREIAGRAVNEFQGNDFSHAKLMDVSFRTGLDLSRQRLPIGPEYTYLEDAQGAVRRARVAFNAWDDLEAKKHAKGVLAVMEENVAAGQRQLLIRVDDYPRTSRAALRALLDAALAA